MTTADHEHSESAGAGGAPMPSMIAAAAAAAAAGGPITTPDVNIEGFEVTQAIQHVNQVGTTLVAGKGTVVRAYIGTNDPSPWLLDGAIEIRPVGPGGPTGPWTLVNSLTSVPVDPAENGQLRLKREHVEKSMNFRVPETLLSASQYEVRLVYVYPFGEFQRRRYVVSRPECNRTYELVASPPLRIHVIGIRYEVGSPPVAHSPTARDFALLRSWLIRAYPVPDVFWTQVTVDYDDPWNNSASDANAFVSAIRAVDVANGTDHRTHYYGLVHDGGGFMRGLAAGIPATPDPSVVASGPTGVSDWGWDFDGSYGDWYGGHELGHTFGRSHAPFCGASGGAPYPHPAGQLSPNNGDWVGFDVGDMSNGIGMQALPGVTYHDVMTYCSFQWLSDFTYNAIRNRLVAEDALAAGPTPPAPGGGAAGGPSGGSAMSVPPSIHIVAAINLTKKTGKFKQVTPGSAPLTNLAAQAPGKTYTVRTVKKDGTPIKDYKAPFRLNACLMPNDDETGSVDVVIPNSADIGGLQLMDGPLEMDKYDPVLEPSKPKNVHSTAAQQGFGPTALVNTDPVIAWEDDTLSGPIPMGAKPPKYTVQISTDNGQTWRAIGLSLHKPQVVIDRMLLSSAQEIQVKVTATNGFRSESTVQKFATKDL